MKHVCVKLLCVVISLPIQQSVVWSSPLIILVFLWFSFSPASLSTVKIAVYQIVFG